MNRIFASLIVFCVAFTVAPLAATAAPITVPSDLNVGDKYRLAFVTSTVRDATSANIADYNAFVTTAANSVAELLALGTTWKAIASTTTVDARDNAGTNPSSTGVPIYRLDDMRIADDNADLWNGNIQIALATIETGAVPSPIGVWTGTEPDGTGSLTRELGVSFPDFGSETFTNSLWINLGSSIKNTPGRLYGVSDVLTVVPEPSTMILACAGAAAAVGWQLRRRRHRNP